MSNFLAWLNANKTRLLCAALAADGFARSAGWTEPVWIGAVLAALAILTSSHSDAALKAMKGNP